MIGGTRPRVWIYGLAVGLLISVLACLEPRPMQDASGAQGVLQFLLPTSSAQLLGGAHRLRVTMEWREVSRVVRDVREIPWDREESNRIPFDRVQSGDVLYTAELFDGDRYLVATASGSLTQQDQASVSIVLRPATPEERMWNQEFRVLVHANTAGKASREVAGQGLTFKDVRDLFDRQNCTVCHRHQIGLDLRQYPFRLEGKAVESDDPLLQKIWSQMVSEHVPPVALLPLSSSEKERLQMWRVRNFPADSSSPLKMATKLYDGEVILTYTIVDAPRLSGEMKLVPRSPEMVFSGVLLGVPRGARMKGEVMVRDAAGISVKKILFDGGILGTDSIKTLAIVL